MEAYPGLIERFGVARSRPRLPGPAEDIPNECRRVGAAGNQRPAVRRKGKGGNTAPVALEVGTHRARAQLPKMNAAIAAARGEPFAVGGERHARRRGAG